MIGEMELKELQRKFEAEEKNAILLKEFSNWLNGLTKQILTSMTKKTGYIFSLDKREVISQEVQLACSHEIFNRKKHIVSFRNFVWTVIRRYIYSKKEIQRDSITFVPLDEAMLVLDDRLVKEEEIDPLEFLLEMKDGEALLKRIYLSKRFDEFIIDIEKEKGLDWVCAHVYKLKLIYLRTRRRRFR